MVIIRQDITLLVEMKGLKGVTLLKDHRSATDFSFLQNYRFMLPKQCLWKVWAIIAAY